MITVTTQSLASAIRQILAVAAFVLGALTAGVSGLHLPTAVSATLMIFGTGLIALEHYFGDPSTNPATNPLLQRISSIMRQVLAVAATVLGLLSASLSSLHLPPAIAALLVAAGPVIVTMEHWVANPSTGNPTPGSAPAPIPLAATAAHTANVPLTFTSPTTTSPTSGMGNP